MKRNDIWDTSVLAQPMLGYLRPCYSSTQCHFGDDLVHLENFQNQNFQKVTCSTNYNSVLNQSFIYRKLVTSWNIETFNKKMKHEFNTVVTGRRKHAINQIPILNMVSRQKIPISTCTDPKREYTSAAFVSLMFIIYGIQELYITRIMKLSE